MVETKTEHEYRTVDEVFASLSISDIQSLEVQLRSRAATKRSDLRLLVGESYRDLLTTADTIVAMRDTTVELRHQLHSFTDHCDSSLVTKKLQNLDEFLNRQQLSKERIVLSYLAGLRALVVHFIRRDELVVAARLYSIGRLASAALVNRKSDFAARLVSVKAILVKAIARCVDVQTFACAFAIIESASPKSCLKYFLSLQTTYFTSCSSLQDLAKLIVHIIDATREFGRLGEAFEQFSKQTLLSPVRNLEEVDMRRLECCLSVELRQYKPYLRSDDITPSDIMQQVDSWLDSTSLQIRDAARSILSKEANIAEIIKQARKVENDLDENSQIRVFTSLSSAVEDRIAELLLDSVTMLDNLQPIIARVIDQAGPVDDLWACKIPWSRGSLQNFKYFTRRVIHGETKLFPVFQTAYLPVLEMIKNNMSILDKSSDQKHRRQEYLMAIDECFLNLHKFLTKSLAQSVSQDTIVCIMRVASYLSKTNPVRITALPHIKGPFRKLIKDVPFTFHSKSLEGCFEQGLPVGLSPSAAIYLMNLNTAVSDIGIDIIGHEERSVVRATVAKTLTASIEEATNSRNLPLFLEKDANGHDAELPVESLSHSNTETDENLAQQQSRSNGLAVMAQTIDPDTEHKNEARSHETVNGHTDSSVPLVLKSTTSDTANESSVFELQNYFDLKFLHHLLLLPVPQTMEKYLKHSTTRELVDNNVRLSIRKNQVLYGTILDSPESSSY